MSRPRFIPHPLPTLAFVTIFLATSCRSVPVSPVVGALAPGVARGGAPETPRADLGLASRVPIITDLDSEVRGDSLYVRGWLRPNVGSSAFYDGSRPGGWMLQLFMNTDQADTGYPWDGVDYLVRGSERLTDGSFVVRRVEEGSDDPAGWGPASGAARLTVGPRSLVLALPLSAIGSDDGQLDFVLETYATVACPEREDGVSHVRVADYGGSTSGPSARVALTHDTPRDRGQEALAAARGGTRLRSWSRVTSDTDARW